MIYDYLKDEYARACLGQAKKVKSRIGFGAVLVKDKKIIGVGRNRRATVEDRKALSHVDYAIHAEQACILDALNRGLDIMGAEVYVLGIALSGANKGTLTVRTDVGFGCRKCPHTFKRFDVPVNIPHVNGWVRLTPDQAMQTGTEFYGNGTWKKFTKGLATI